jgi:hypothetical protein
MVGFLIAPGAGRFAQRHAIEPLHENGIAVDIEDSGGTIAFIPLQETCTPALFVGGDGLEDFERREIAAILLNPENPAARCLRHEGGLGEGPADHGAAERGFCRRLIHHGRH